MGEIDRLMMLGKRALAYTGEHVMTSMAVAMIGMTMLSGVTDFIGFTLQRFWPLGLTVLATIPWSISLMIQPYITGGSLSLESWYMLLTILLTRILVFTVLEAFIYKGQTAKKFLGLETVRKKDGERLDISRIFIRNLVKHTVAGICPVFLITNIHNFASGAVTREKERVVIWRV